MRRCRGDQGTRAIAFAGAVALLACDRPASTSSPAPPPPASPTSVSTPVPLVTASPSGSTPSPPAPVEPRDPELPPTPAEWKARGQSVTVDGADGWGCVGQMIEAWLRVACTGTADHRPEGVEVTRGGGGGMTFAITQPRQTSLVLPFVEGVDVRATFTFSGGEAELRVSWPRGAEAPATKGEMTARE